MHDDPKSKDVWITCPNCHRVMVPLATYEIQDSAGPAVGAELWQFLAFGWIIFVWNYVFGAAQHASDKTKLAEKKAEILPNFPGSQICNECFHVTKRK